MLSDGIVSSDLDILTCFCFLFDNSSVTNAGYGVHGWRPCDGDEGAVRIQNVSSEWTNLACTCPVTQPLLLWSGQFAQFVKERMGTHVPCIVPLCRRDLNTLAVLVSTLTPIPCTHHADLGHPNIGPPNVDRIENIHSVPGSPHWNPG